MIPAYRDASLPIDARVTDLLGRMTVAQQCAQLNQLGGPVPEFKIPALVRRCGSVLTALGEPADALQRAALAEPLGIPLLFGIDAIHGHGIWPGATVFPSQLGQACAWDEDLVRAMARATAREVAATGSHWTFSPVLCRPRDLRWGRVGETFGEDQLLIERLGVAMVEGFQGKDLRDPESIAACLKAYLAYAETVGGRDGSDCELSERQIRARLLKPFAAAVRAGAATVMTAYHAIDGVPCSASNRWLNEVLRDEVGFAGMVVTDWDCVGRMVWEHHLASEVGEAGGRCLAAGSDLLMATDCAQTLENEVNAGRLEAAVVAKACARILELKFRLGLFEDPRMSSPERIATVIGCPEHRQLARQAALQSLTLVRNRDRTLPLKLDRIRRLALIGPGADDPVAMNGDWSLGAAGNQSNGGCAAEHPRAASITLRDGLEHRLAGTGIELSHVLGCGEVLVQAGCWNTPRRQPGQVTDPAAARRIAAAVRAAEGADAVVLVLGDPAEWWGEFHSTATLELPPVQRQLFDAVRATGTPLVVVLQASKPLAVPWIIDGADAVLVAFNPGMEGGSAMAAVLFGDDEPGGRLAISFPHHVGQLPVAYDSPSVAHNDRYVDTHLAFNDPLLAFGEGLGYTSFRLTGHRLEGNRVLVEVRNTGERVGSTVVQVYARAPTAPASRPPRWLVGWQRVSVAPGKQALVGIDLIEERLLVCDARGQWVRPAGPMEILVGTSSRERDLTVLTLRGA